MLVMEKGSFLSLWTSFWASKSPELAASSSELEAGFAKDMVGLDSDLKVGECLV